MNTASNPSPLLRTCECSGIMLEWDPAQAYPESNDPPCWRCNKCGKKEPFSPQSSSNAAMNGQPKSSKWGEIAPQLARELAKYFDRPMPPEGTIEYEMLCRRILLYFPEISATTRCSFPDQQTSFSKLEILLKKLNQYFVEYDASWDADTKSKGLPVLDFEDIMESLRPFIDGHNALFDELKNLQLENSELHKEIASLTEWKLKEHQALIKASILLFEAGCQGDGLVDAIKDLTTKLAALRKQKGE